MPTEKQIAANKTNAQKSTGPNTIAGKETSARNALKHGLSAQRYLTSSETAEEFAALYATRRRLYPSDDPIIDRLIEKITLAHLRICRGFEAEADILSQGTLAEMLVQHEKPVKSLGAYEASNRKMLKILEEELARYLAMLREMGNVEFAIAEPTVGTHENKKVAAPTPAAANDTAARSTATAETPPKNNSKTKSAARNEATTDGPSLVTATKPVATSATMALENQKTNPISTVNGTPTPVATESSSTPAIAQASEQAPVTQPIPSPPAAASKPLIQNNFDIPNWNPPPRR